MVLKNDILNSGVVRDKPFIVDIEDKATTLEKEINIENKIESILLSMDNRIGEYSNIATCYHNKCAQNEEQKRKYEKFIDLVSIANAKEIDYAKYGVRYNLPKYIARYAKPLPYFMRYAGVYYTSLYEAQRKRLYFNEDAKRTFNKSQSNMNRLCYELEKWNTKIKFKHKYKDFDYSIMIDSVIPHNEETYFKIYDLYLKFCQELRELQKQNNIKYYYTEYDENIGDLSRYEMINTKINWKYYYDEYRQKALEICPNVKELANYAVEICYVVFPKKSKKFIWVVAADGILKNLKQQTIELPIADEDGIYLYLGRKYNLKEIQPEIAE